MAEITLELGMDHNTQQQAFDLETTRNPLRLAFTDGDGFPRIVSLWFQYIDGEFFCATHETAWVVDQLRQRPKVGYEVASNTAPYHGVRGTATVEVYPMDEDPLLERLLQRYLGSANTDFARRLLDRSESELIIRIKPLKQTSWDYRRRMEGAIAPAVQNTELSGMH